MDREASWVLVGTVRLLRSFLEREMGQRARHLYGKMLYRGHDGNAEDPADGFDERTPLVASDPPLANTNPFQ